MLDVEVMDRIKNAFPHTLLEFWQQEDPELIRTGEGYNVSKSSAQYPAAFLKDMPSFTSKDAKNSGFLVPDRLCTYKEIYQIETANMPRRKELFEGPLAIVAQSPGEKTTSPKGFVSDKELAFTKSFYGYSCAGHSQEKNLQALIHVLSHSLLCRYFIFMTSGSLGVDRMKFHKDDFDALPFPDPAKLPAKTKKALLDFSARLQAGEGQMPAVPSSSKKTKGKKKSASHSAEADFFKEVPGTPATSPNQQRQRALAFWDELNAFIFSLYGLGADDVQVIQDTLFASAPYRRAGEAAFLPTAPQPSEDTTHPRQVFCQELQQRLQPFFKVTGETVHVGEPPGLRQQSWDTTWRFIAIWTGEAAPQSIPPEVLRQAMELANEQGSSRIIVRLPGERALLVGLLDARRWWTRTRARLCAHTITLEHLDAFDPPKPYEPPARRRTLDLRP